MPSNVMQVGYLTYSKLFGDINFASKIKCSRLQKTVNCDKKQAIGFVLKA